MDSSDSQNFELGGSTPDSGIDLSRFNIVEYIMGDGDDDIPANNDIAQLLSQESTESTPTSKEMAPSLPPLRTLSKQDWQRKKALEEAAREKSLLDALQPPPQSTPVNLPAPSPPNLTNIPRNVLRVETRLENPTPFHLQQRVMNQISRYNLDSGGDGARGGSMPPAAYQTNCSIFNQQHQQTAAGSAPPNIFAPPLAQSINSSVTSDDILDPISGLEVDTSLTFNDFSLKEIGQLIISQDGDSSSVFSFTPSAASASAPSATETPTSGAGGTPLPSPGTPQDDSSLHVNKDRQKKDNHNKIERRRRYHINDMITLQGQQLPKPNEPYYDKFGEVKQNKGAILQASVDYIQILKDENDTYRQKEQKNTLKISQSEHEKRQLLLRIQELEQLCRRSGVSIPEESLHWRPQPPETIATLINEPIHVKQELMEDSGNMVVTGEGDPMLGGGDDDDDLVLEDFTMELS